MFYKIFFHRGFEIFQNKIRSIKKLELLRKFNRYNVRELYFGTMVLASCTVIVGAKNKIRTSFKLLISRKAWVWRVKVNIFKKQSLPFIVLNKNLVYFGVCGSSSGFQRGNEYCLWEVNLSHYLQVVSLTYQSVISS